MIQIELWLLHSSILSIHWLHENVRVNGELIDFSHPLLSVDLAPGCGFTDTLCNPNPCSNEGKCTGSWGSFICDFKPQFAGTICKEGL